MPNPNDLATKGNLRGVERRIQRRVKQNIQKRAETNPYREYAGRDRTTGLQIYRTVNGGESLALPTGTSGIARGQSTLYTTSFIGPIGISNYRPFRPTSNATPIPVSSGSPAPTAVSVQRVFPTVSYIIDTAAFTPGPEGIFGPLPPTFPEVFAEPTAGTIGSVGDYPDPDSDPDVILTALSDYITGNSLARDLNVGGLDTLNPPFPLSYNFSVFAAYSVGVLDLTGNVTGPDTRAPIIGARLNYQLSNFGGSNIPTASAVTNAPINTVVFDFINSTTIGGGDPAEMVVRGNLNVSVSRGSNPLTSPYESDLIVNIFVEGRRADTEIEYTSVISGVTGSTTFEHDEPANVEWEISILPSERLVVEYLQTFDVDVTTANFTGDNVDFRVAIQEIEYADGLIVNADNPGGSL